MSEIVQIDGLADVIQKELDGYSGDVTSGTKKVVDTVAKGVMQTIKDHISFREISGRYVAAFRLKTVEETPFSKNVTWYVQSPQSHLTHLLEFGHAKRSGGRTRAFPHIQFGEEYALENLPKAIEDVVTSGH